MNSPYIEIENTERKTIMKNENFFLSSKAADNYPFLVEKTEGSQILTAKAHIYVPEKNIVLASQATEHEKQILSSVCHYMGGRMK